MTKTSVADASLSERLASVTALMAMNVDKNRVVVGVRRAEFGSFNRFSGRNQHRS